MSWPEPPHRFVDEVGCQGSGRNDESGYAMRLGPRKEHSPLGPRPFDQFTGVVRTALVPEAGDVELLGEAVEGVGEEPVNPLGGTVGPCVVRLPAHAVIPVGVVPR